MNLLSFGLNQKAEAQVFLSINDSASGQPLTEAIVYYQELTADKPGRLQMSIADVNGKAVLPYTGLYLLQVSVPGYRTYSDTLQIKQSLIITLPKLNLQLDEVVVTGQYQQTIAEQSVHRIKVIGQERITTQGAVNLRDLLTNELNIQLSQDNILGSSMSLQGISGQNVKILVDGVPIIGRLDGNIDLSQINLNNIERIEVIEGPMSVIYGTDALGGVINLITKKQTKNTTEVGANTYYESVGHYNFDANVALGGKRSDIRLSLGRNYFDGFAADESSRWRQWKPKEQFFGDLSIGFKHKNTRHRLQSAYFDETITNRGVPVINPHVAYAFDDYYHTYRLNNAIYSDINFRNKATLNLINSFSYYQRRKNTYRRDLTTITDVLTTNEGDQDTSRFDLALFRATYTTQNGSKLNHQLGYDINIEWGTGNRLEGGDQRIGDFAGFYSLEYKPIEKLVLRPGLRFSHNTRYGSPLIPSFNVKHNLGKSVVLRGSYARGFRAPSLKELNLFFVDINHNIRGNNDLKAEQSNSYNASIAYTWRPKKKQKLTFESAVFYNEIFDMIGLAMVDDATQLFTYVNIANFESQGANLNMTWQLGALQATAGISRIGTSNSQVAPDNRLPAFNYRNEARANITYTLPVIKTDVSIFYKYTGRAPNFILTDTNTVVQRFTDNFTMADVSLRQQFLKQKLTLVVGMKNLFDITNINTALQNGGAHSSGSGVQAIGMGRTYFVNLRLRIANENQ